MRRAIELLWHSRRYVQCERIYAASHRILNLPLRCWSSNLHAAHVRHRTEFICVDDRHNFICIWTTRIFLVCLGPIMCRLTQSQAARPSGSPRSLYVHVRCQCGMWHRFYIPLSWSSAIFSIFRCLFEHFFRFFLPFYAPLNTRIFFSRPIPLSLRAVVIYFDVAESINSTRITEQSSSSWPSSKIFINKTQAVHDRYNNTLLGMNMRKAHSPLSNCYFVYASWTIIWGIPRGQSTRYGPCENPALRYKETQRNSHEIEQEMENMIMNCFILNISCNSRRSSSSHKD